MNRWARGLVVGTVATTALNLATYADMLVRGRPASAVPADAVGTLAGRAGVRLGDEPRAAHRREAAGVLSGYATGVGLAMSYVLAEPHVRGRRPFWVVAAAVGATAMTVGNVPAIASGSTHPRQWDAADWLADVVPHAAYGLAAVATADAIGRPS
ncbi:hypothetical protein E1212_16540 [Jiangella ureilytica]|uniref:DUF1440 domain-containing protein n=1 Tax=Jiangella ureilytica TaxID=2530374 RepID=A0A4R4RKD4_9ACTN|nr:hypothetical protein [Jiangella ureilytica]TDC50027.1 hypothetical protein E1212_16540 [Jiangella ureilytica]